MGYDPAGTLDWGAIGRFIGGAVIAIGGTAYTLATIPISIIPGSGFLTEAGLSMAMYGGFMAGSAFDSAIKADMDAIGWNPFNSDEGLVLGSSKVSFYKGQAVVRGNFPGCASFGIMLVDKGDWVKVDTIKHEYGHFIQLGILGLPKFALGIAVPSPIGTQLVPEEFYHSQPWEVTADILGGASQFDHYPGWETIGWLYFFALLL